MQVIVLLAARSAFASVPIRQGGFFGPVGGEGDRHVDATGLESVVWPLGCEVAGLECGCPVGVGVLAHEHRDDHLGLDPQPAAR